MVAIMVSGQAAIWDGESGAWASEQWGSELTDGWPGDVNHPTTPVEINMGGVKVEIRDEDSLLLDHPAGTMIKAGTVIQTGGTFTSNSRLDIRDGYQLSGGTLTGKGSIWISHEGKFRIAGGRLEAPDAEIVFQAGPGTLQVSLGEVDIGHIIMNKESAAEAVLEVIGSEATLKVLTFRLSGAGGISTAKFVFDASGISGWQVRGGPGSLNLGPKDNPGNLTVDVTACPSSGTEGFQLFDYTIPTALTGGFGDIVVSQGSLRLTPLESGTPKPGQYRLDLEDGEIVLYYHTPAKQ